MGSLSKATGSDSKYGKPTAVTPDLSKATGSDSKYGTPTQKQTFIFNNVPVLNPSYSGSTRGGITQAEQAAQMSIADEAARNQLSTPNTKLQALKEAAERTQQQNITAIKKTQTPDKNIFGVQQAPQSKEIASAAPVVPVQQRRSFRGRGYSGSWETEQKPEDINKILIEKQPQRIENVKQTFRSIFSGQGAQISVGNDRTKEFISNWVIPQNAGEVALMALPVGRLGGKVAAKAAEEAAQKAAPKLLPEIWKSAQVGAKKSSIWLEEKSKSKIGNWVITGAKGLVLTEAGILASRSQEYIAANPTKRDILKEIAGDKTGNNVLQLQRVNVQRIATGKSALSSVDQQIEASEVETGNINLFGKNFNWKAAAVISPIVQSGVNVWDVTLGGRKFEKQQIEANRQYYLGLGYPEQEAKKRAQEAYSIFKRREAESDISLVGQSAFTDIRATRSLLGSFSKESAKKMTANQLKNFLTWEGAKTLTSYSLIEANLNRVTERQLFKEGAYKNANEAFKDAVGTSASGAGSALFFGLPVFRYAGTNKVASKTFQYSGYAMDLSELGGDIALDSYLKVRKSQGAKIRTPTIFIQTTEKGKSYNVGISEEVAGKRRIQTPTGIMDVVTQQQNNQQQQQTARGKNNIFTSMFNMNGAKSVIASPINSDILNDNIKQPNNIQNVQGIINQKTPDIYNNQNNQQQNLINEINQNIIGENVKIGSFTPQMRVPPPLPPMFTIPSGSGLGFANKNKLFVNERSEAGKILKSFGFTKFAKEKKKKKGKK